MKVLRISCVLVLLGISVKNIFSVEDVRRFKPQKKVDQGAPQEKQHQESSSARRARARDKKTFALFTAQLNIYNHPHSNVATKTISALRLLRLYKEFIGEELRSAALTQLNKQGLTVQKLRQIAEEGRTWYRITQIAKYFKAHKPKGSRQEALHRRAAREMLRLYDEKLTLEQKARFDRELKEMGLSIDMLKNRAPSKPTDMRT